MRSDDLCIGDEVQHGTPNSVRPLRIPFGSMWHFVYCCLFRLLCLLASLLAVLFVSLVELDPSPSVFATEPKSPITPSVPFPRDAALRGTAP